MAVKDRRVPEPEPKDPEKYGCCIDEGECVLEWFCPSAPYDRRIDMLPWDQRYTPEEQAKIEIGLLGQKFRASEVDQVLVLTEWYKHAPYKEYSFLKEKKSD